MPGRIMIASLFYPPVLIMLATPAVAFSSLPTVRVTAFQARPMVSLKGGAVERGVVPGGLRTSTLAPSLMRNFGSRFGHEWRMESAWGPATKKGPKGQVSTHCVDAPVPQTSSMQVQPVGAFGVITGRRSFGKLGSMDSGGREMTLLPPKLTDREREALLAAAEKAMNSAKTALKNKDFAGARAL
ncbi:hypothetical protein T484DRAFT_1790166, partial [Baffinella frigidus]